MSATLTLPAPAKLNLGLRITGRRPDGYHNLQTLFQLLDFGDELEFTATDDGQIRFESNFSEVTPEANLVVRAAHLLREQTAETLLTGITPADLGARITLNKRLPAGGGLGGGSSDAATTLLALNHLWGLNRSNDELAELGASLGADVPVFVHGRSAWAEGIGEQLTAVEIPLKWYLVLIPQCHVSTAEIFQHTALTRNNKALTIRAFFALPQTEQRYNATAELVRKLYPSVDDAIRWLSQHTLASLTGTGACVYGAFDKESEARKIAALSEDHWSGFVAKGVNFSPVQQALSRG